MSEKATAVYLVTARGKNSSTSVGVANATAALAKVRELQADGFVVVVLDDAGRERAIEELKIRAAEDERAT